MTLLFDTETTDLITNSLVAKKNQPHVVEFYGVHIDEDGNKVGELSLLIKPPISMPEEARRITGIDDAMLSSAPAFRDVSQAISEFITKADVVVAHNLSYDRSMIDTEFSRLGTSIDWPKRQICTVEETEWIKGYRLSLKALHEHLFGEEFSGAHRAQVDVEAMVRCFIKLRKEGTI